MKNIDRDDDDRRCPECRLRLKDRWRAGMVECSCMAPWEGPHPRVGDGCDTVPYGKRLVDGFLMIGED